MVSLRPLLYLAVLTVAYSETKPQNIRVSTWVREDLFAGFIDADMDRFERGVKKLDAVLADSPKAADALGWHAGNTLFLAVRAYEAGDNNAFESGYAKALDLFDRIAAIAREEPQYKEAVHAITGGSFSVFSDRLPPKYRRDGWQRVRENYLALREAQRPAFDTANFPLHFRGEVMAGLAQAAQRLGEAEQAKTLTQELVKAFPGTPYAAFGQRWLDKPETMAKTKLTCGTCHDAGRLQATLDRQKKN
ncbi:MAG: hypothetical protein HYX27_24815 [Acidobacteria bacterium]|nr:hypothetical protein [Acidobacteriota bacterium]